ncbi:MAG TPA: hypothetical protein VGJ07_00040 [Rugosimonospora sp.]|jgi:hypothetical protein
MPTPNPLGPVPSPQEWQELVRSAIREIDESKPRLRWTARDEIRWDLNGECPHCGDYMSVLVSGVILADSPFESADLIEILAECSCEPGHSEGRRGCGAGRGDYIRVPAPRTSTE